MPASDRHKKQHNTLVEFFSSVQLALFLLAILALTAIIGTIVPQNAAPEFYAHRYGPGWARFFELLDIGDMYNAWWFLSLLALFAANLVVCSLERIPKVIAMLRRDHMALTRDQLARFPEHREMASSLPAAELVARVRAILKEQGWKAKEREAEGGILFFSQKTPWARLGVYVVHLSILVILAGAVLGSPAFGRRVLRQADFAFKGFVMLPEGASTDAIQSNRGGEPVNLGFTLRCERFDIDFYENGMPKSYRSRLAVLEDGKEVLERDVEVNRPLKHRGVTVYQASYQPSPEYRLRLRKQPDDLETSVTIPPAREARWPEAGISYGIINRDQGPDGETTRRIKLWLHDGTGEPSTLWLDMREETVVERPSGRYLITAHQRSATGLQVAKDPGVGLVYGGCLLMLLGLYAAFFLAHRRLFALVTPQAGGSALLFAGEAHKNPVQFARNFQRMADLLEQRLAPESSEDAP